jgi:signal transduction histidine kinase
MVTPKLPRSIQTASLLANVQQELEILFASTLESILLIEATGIVLAANDVSAKWLNRRAESLSGENLFQLLTPFGVPIREWVHQVVSNKTIHERDFLFDERFIHIRLIPVSTRNKVRRLIIIGQDITEQKRVEEQFRELTGQLEHKVRERTAKLETLNKKLAKDKQQAETLASLSQHLMQDTRDYSQLLEHITDEISDLIGDTCLIALFTSDLTLIEVQAITDRDAEGLPHLREQLLNRPISVETNVIASSILKGERFSARKIAPESYMNLLPTEFVSLLGEGGIIALEVFPLQAGDQVLGMLAISRDYGDSYSEDDISFVSSLASPIALALQNARLFEQLSENQNQLRGLSQKLVQAQENHFRKIAGEVHDQIGQDMTAINVNLNILQNMLPQTTSEDIILRLADTEKLVKESVNHMRSLMSELRPPMLDQYGLTSALSWYCEQYQRRTETKIIINDLYMKNKRLTTEIEIALFRIAQEALNNIAKHANATQVDIELFEEEGEVMMAITDNGEGFDTRKQASTMPAHWGLALMEERARAIHGEFLIRSVPRRGTQIVVQVRNSA